MSSSRQLRFKLLGNTIILQSWQEMIQLQSLINQLQKDGNHLRAIKQAKKSSSFEETQLKILTPSSVLLFIEKLNDKNYSLSLEQSERSSTGDNMWSNRWHPNQYKHFMWLTFGYFYVKNTPITSFNEQDIDFFSKVFSQKERVFLQYHLLVLLKQNKSKREIWSKQETELLYQLMNSEKYKGKWSDISYRLYFYSNKKYFKSSHKCREMWFNHLNPNVSHNKWTLEEDIRLFKHVSRIGTKWAQISKAMEGVRTQHMVKNRFNSLIKKYSLKYQRYSCKKLAQIIQKDLQAKLQANQGCESSKDNKQDQQISDEIKMEKQEGKQEILFIQTQKIELNNPEENPHSSPKYVQNQNILLAVSKVQQNKAQHSSPLAEKNHIQHKLIIPEFKIQRERPVQNSDNSKNLSNYDMDFENMNNNPNEGEVIHIQWAVMYKVSQVELIDYLGIDYESKPTIFSGTN